MKNYLATVRFLDGHIQAIRAAEQEYQAWVDRKGWHKFEALDSAVQHEQLLENSILFAKRDLADWVIENRALLDYTADFWDDLAGIIASDSVEANHKQRMAAIIERLRAMGIREDSS